jgi:tRNA dimethylallyltransferase
MSTKTVIQVAGPTAVGKTAVAIQLAQWLNTEIISFDSRQCFKELNIGVARPSESELQAVPHHFIASHSIHDKVDAASFATYAQDQLNQLFKRYAVVVMVGGTGLYWKAFYEGLDKIPAIDPAIRSQVIEGYQKNGLAWLQEQVLQKDPLFASTGEMKNPQRLMRALEVIEATGQSIFSYREKREHPVTFDLISIGLELPRPQLIERINARVNSMIQQGLVEEVKALYSFSSLNALQTVGYQEIFAFLNQLISVEQAIEQIKINTRQYAKRQMTWFRKQAGIEWFEPAQLGAIKELIKTRLH